MKNKSYKKNIILFAFCLMVCAMTFCIFIACDDGTDPAVKNTYTLEYDLSDYGDGYMVTGLGNFNGDELDIPSEHNGRPVVEIAADAFMDGAEITIITIPDTVEQINLGALRGCSSLQELTLPFAGQNPDATDKEALFGNIFGKKAFSNALSTQQIYNENGEYTSFRIPNSLRKIYFTGEKIPYGAFSNLGSLTEFVVETSVKSISDAAFNGCVNLDWVYLRSSGVANNCNTMLDNGMLLAYASEIYVDTGISLESYGKYLKAFTTKASGKIENSTYYFFNLADDMKQSVIECEYASDKGTAGGSNMSDPGAAPALHGPTGDLGALAEWNYPNNGGMLGGMADSAGHWAEYTVTASEDVAGILSLMLGTHGVVPLDNIYTLEVNGKSVSIKGSVAPARNTGNEWYDWQLAKLGIISLQQGPNTIKITTIAGPGNAHNLDYFLFSSATNAELSVVQ